MSAKAPVYALMVAVSLLWGVAFVGIKEALAFVSPSTLTLLRFAVADAGLLVMALLWRGARPVSIAGDGPRYIALAVLGIPVYHLAITWGEDRTGAGAAALIVATAPVMVAVLSMLVLRESIPARRALGIALAFGGVAVLSLKGSPAPGEHATQISGVLVAMLSPMSWAVYTVLARPLLQRVPAMRMTSTVFLIGGVTLLPLIRASTFREAVAMPAAGWAWVVFLGLGSSVAGYLVFNIALARMEAAKVAVFLYMVPVVALLSARVILGEPLTKWVALAAVLVVGGVVVTEREGRKARAAA